MIALWLVIGLIIATVSVAALGAGFSVLGIAALFSGAALAAGAMAIALEFAKFVLSAYLHQRWNKLNVVFKYYISFAIIVLSLITSMGIFGFLSGAYQSASNVLETENIKLNALKEKQNRLSAEIVRLNSSIDEIPVSRVSKRIQARAELEPAIAEINKQVLSIDGLKTQSNLKILEVKEKVGPLIYIARSLNQDIDTVVKYLIFLFVFVFDPLAICLVVATSEALESRRRENAGASYSLAMAQPQGTKAAMEKSPAADSKAAVPETGESSDVIQMRFVDPNDKNAV